MHEQTWYPASIRRHFQDALGSIGTRLNIHKGASKRIAQILREVGATEVMDLCSGASDPIVQLCEQAASADESLKDLHVYLTDLYPNVPRFKEHQARHPNVVRFCKNPIDATHTPADAQLPRVRTILSALHHFKPDQVRAIFKDAAANADAIIVLDVPQRSLSLVLASLVFAFPLAYGLCATRRESWKWDAILSTIVVPIVPFTFWVDGMVSVLRGYTPDELLTLAHEADSSVFSWETGTLSGRYSSTYVYGQRRDIKQAKKRGQTKMPHGRDAAHSS